MENSNSLIAATEVNKGTSVSLLCTPCEATHSVGLNRPLDIKDVEQSEQTILFLRSTGFTVGSTWRKWKAWRWFIGGKTSNEQLCSAVCVTNSEPYTMLCISRVCYRNSHALKSPKISSFEIWSEFTTIATENTSGFLILDGNNTFERYEPWSAHTNQCLSPPLDWHRNWPCSLRSSCQVRQKMSRKLKPTSDHQEQMFRLNMNPCDAGCVEAGCQGWAALRRFKPKADSGAALWPSPPFPLS